MVRDPREAIKEVAGHVPPIRLVLFELHALVAVADALAEAAPRPLERGFVRELARVSRGLRVALEAPDAAVYPRYVVGLSAGGLGYIGSSRLLGWFGVLPPPASFEARALRLFAVAASEKSTLSFASWRVQEETGSLLRRNGLPDDPDAIFVATGAGQQPLRHVRLTTTSPHTDRRFCSEFRLLLDLHAKLRDEGGAIEGEVLLFISRPPCLSCVGALLQFRRQFPGLTLRAGFPSESAELPR